jgi:hypothetical protein
MEEAAEGVVGLDLLHFRSPVAPLSGARGSLAADWS